MAHTLIPMPLLLQAAASMDGGGSAPRPPFPPGRPGDFDFLAGEWRIHNRRPTPDGGFDEFPGQASVIRLLEGAASIEELRIPAKGFSGLGLRLLDPNTQVWRDTWINARHGVVEGPGMAGGFEDGSGLFEADDRDGDTAIKVRGIWDQITPASCRCRQAVSRDGGQTWIFNWWMAWTRA